MNILKYFLKGEIIMLNFILALLPIIWLIIAMSILKMPGYRACLLAFVITFALGVAVWHMPVINAATAALEGICNALWPIIIVILAALYTYNLTLETKAMDAIKAMLASVSTDKRVLTLLIAFGFGNFMEGMAGFGTAVAIPAGILVDLCENLDYTDIDTDCDYILTLDLCFQYYTEKPIT